MRKSHVPGVDSIPSKEFVRKFVWRLGKCSSECHILSLTNQIRNTTKAMHK